MTKTNLLLALGTITVLLTSCQEGLSTIVESDYKVVEINYGFDNYHRNVKDKSEEIIIKERNLVSIEVDKNGKILVEDIPTANSLLVSELKKYLIPNPKNDEMPNTIVEEFEYSGKVIVHKNLLVLAKFDSELNYKEYSGIRNKIYATFNDIRNEFTKRKFNKTLNELLNSDDENRHLKWNEVRRAFPFNYTEYIVEQ